MLLNRNERRRLARLPLKQFSQVMMERLQLLSLLNESVEGDLKKAQESQGKSRAQLLAEANLTEKALADLRLVEPAVALQFLELIARRFGKLKDDEIVPIELRAAFEEVVARAGPLVTPELLELIEEFRLSATSTH